MHTKQLQLLSGEYFHIDVAGTSPALVSDARGIRIDLSRLEPSDLLVLKNMAHNQYVKSMLFGDEDADVHRATLNYVSRHLERSGNPATAIRPSRPRRRTGRPRRAAA